MNITIPTPRAIALAALMAVLAPPALASTAQTEYEAGVEAMRDFHFTEAQEHFRLAAGQGHRDALRTWGLMLLYGESLYGPALHRKTGQAVALLRQAADQGCEVSRFVLARLGHYQGC